MFNNVTAVPPDPILGLTEAFRNDPSPHKVNLAVGEYKDESGNTPILDCVREAERRMLAAESTKGYLPIDGDRRYGELVQEILWGSDHPLVGSQRVATLQTPGGTGALRVAAEFVCGDLEQTQVWFSKPTWPNHGPIFAAAGMTPKEYPYFDAATNGLDFAAMCQALDQAPAGELVVLHGCCHNPTGVDLTESQWHEVAQIVARRKLLPLIDFAYQGFSESVESDAVGLRIVADAVPELLVCSSYSKNFGLYRERVGALTVVTPAEDVTAAVLSRIKKRIRVNYSNPPFHGAGIVANVLADSQLREQWRGEVDQMRDRINKTRSEFVDGMNQLAPTHDFSFIHRQRGMFSFSGLTADHVERLRSEHAIYVVGSGRINVAGLNQQNLPRVCEAIAAVLK